ncbi:hypothetical protein P4H77_28780, partial [Bacillus cereus]|nr:hypothetical protein [Bacillus cereus]MEB9244335.1 hypothetical protein [Bacillus cereus]MEB9365107.1 hypothetical protein [Bacillus cereus]
MKFIEIIKRSFDSSHVYSQQELIQIVQTLDLSPENVIPYITAHAHQLKDGYKTKFCSFELKSPQMGGFIKN